MSSSFFSVPSQARFVFWRFFIVIISLVSLGLLFTQAPPPRSLDPEKNTFTLSLRDSKTRAPIKRAKVIVKTSSENWNRPKQVPLETSSEGKVADVLLANYSTICVDALGFDIQEILIEPQTHRTDVGGWKKLQISRDFPLQPKNIIELELSRKQDYGSNPNQKALVKGGGSNR